MGFIAIYCCNQIKQINRLCTDSVDLLDIEGESTNNYNSVRTSQVSTSFCVRFNFNGHRLLLDCLITMVLHFSPLRFTYF
jgi:hypothetical protein